MSRPGIEPGLRPSEGLVRLHYTIGTSGRGGRRTRKITRLSTWPLCRSLRTRPYLFAFRTPHSKVAQAGVEPAESRRFELRRFTCLRTRAVMFLPRRCLERESNPQTSGFKPDRSADWRIQAIADKAPGVGIEPTTSWFRARRHHQQQLPRNGKGSGRRDRTFIPCLTGRSITVIRCRIKLLVKSERWESNPRSPVPETGGIPLSYALVSRGLDEHVASDAAKLWLQHGS